MRRLLLVLAVTAGLLVLSPGTSWACSCALSTTAQFLNHADTVLDGTVEWSATNGITTTYSVKAAEVFKGLAGVREKLITPAHDASCGLGDLAIGKRYLFFVRGRHPGAMQVDLCGGSTLYDAALAAQVQAATGPPTRPIPERTAVVSGQQGSGHHWGWITGALVVAAGLAGALTWSRRKLRL